MTDATTGLAAPPVVSTAPQGPRASLWALRVAAVIHALVIFAQPVLAGVYLAGDVGAIGNHEVNAHTVTSAAALQFIAALIYGWRGRGRLWPLWLSLALPGLEEAQKILGYAGVLDAHIPLGVTLVVVQILFTIWVFGPTSRLARVRRKRRT
ncbi:hypothetical protein [Actinopolymorpha alba]|uniref:hypothetical protein n=1 Tax=Actinopolymorpha alba TaxID=533267 RepID=UPI00037E4A74|nr:hypothetical protein [Actinopolymorpha alba]